MARLWQFLLLLVLAALAAAKTGQNAIDELVGDIEGPGPVEGSMSLDGELDLPEGAYDIRVPEGHVCADREMTDCYPKIFVPTKHFQEVREGQDLPKGLHVRLNLETGKREAKLYNPKEDEETAALVAVGDVFDTPEEELAADTSDWYSSQAFESVPPPRPQEREELESFRQILFSEKPSDKRIEEALDGIEELSHDRSLGVAIAKDSYLLRNFVQILKESHNAELRRKAAQVIGSALQNNPTAWNATRSMISPGEETQWPLLSLLTERLKEEEDFKVKASIVFALKQAISRSRSARTFFIKDLEGYVVMGSCLSPYLEKDYAAMERIPPSYEEVEDEAASGTGPQGATDSPIPRVRRDRKEGYTPPETSHTAAQREHIANVDNLASKIAILVRDLLAMNRQFAPVPRHETTAKKEARLAREEEERDENVAAVKEWNTVLNYVLDGTKGDPMSDAVWTLADISNELNYCQLHYKRCWPGHDN